MMKRRPDIVPDHPGMVKSLPGMFPDQPQMTKQDSKIIPLHSEMGREKGDRRKIRAPQSIKPGR
jgi:hypothetical protein